MIPWHAREWTEVCDTSPPMFVNIFTISLTIILFIIFTITLCLSSVDTGVWLSGRAIGYSPIGHRFDPGCALIQGDEVPSLHGHES